MRESLDGKSFITYSIYAPKLKPKIHSKMSFIAVSSTLKTENKTPDFLLSTCRAETREREKKTEVNVSRAIFYKTRFTYGAPNQ